MTKLSLWSCALVLALGSGCVARSRQSTSVPASSQQTYAVGYADDVAARSRKLRERQEKARDLFKDFSTYPDAVKKADPALVLEIINRADSAGQSSAYVARAQESSSVSAFFAEERTPISQKVAGAARSPDSKVDMSGNVSAVLKKSIDERIDKRQRARSDAHLLIERHRTTLGADASKLEKQADDIAMASYVIYVELPEERARLERLVDEAGAVAETNARSVTEERAIAEKGKGEEKKAAEARIAEIKKGQDKVESTLTDARTALEAFDKQYPEIRKDYEAALGKLREAFHPKTK
ncbi:MAG: hypothetical protein WCI05_05925 [Myxococcales bacterium]